MQYIVSLIFSENVIPLNERCDLSFHFFLENLQIKAASLVFRWNWD